MFLSDRDIREEVHRGHLRIEPFNEGNIQPNSYDITLGSDFKMLDESHESGGIIDFEKEPIYRSYEGIFILPAMQFALGTTLEYIALPDDIIASVQGRSSIGRRGLFIQNAGWIDSGFEGTLTLELFNPNNLGMILREGTRIGQLTFAYANPSEHPYHGKYSGQRGTTGSKSYLDREYGKR